jgi:hypothetical protein
VHLLSVYLINVHLTGVYLMSMHVTDVHLMSVHFVGVYPIICKRKIRNRKNVFQDSNRAPRISGFQVHLSDFCSEIEESCLLVCHFYLPKGRLHMYTRPTLLPEAVLALEAYHATWDLPS